MSKQHSSATHWFIDTHCHMNLIIKSTFNKELTPDEIKQAQVMLQQAHTNQVNYIVNVGTSLIETHNCIQLSQTYDNLFTVAGLHPTDLTETWYDEFQQLKQLVHHKDEYRIVGIGETGIDKYWPGYHLQRQIDAFKAHIELALTYNLAIIVHTRQAAHETLAVLEQYAKYPLRGIIHCFPYDHAWAQEAIKLGYVLGIGGPVTYPNNKQLHNVVQQLNLEYLVLETDAPYLPPQSIRGKSNSPSSIKEIAQQVAYLKNTNLDHIAHVTTKTASRIFNLARAINN